MAPRLLVLTACAVAIAGCTQSAAPSGPSGPLPVAGQSLSPGEESAETLTRLGIHALDRGDATGAIALFRRAHAIDPAAEPPLLSLGQTYRLVGAHFEAEGAYRVLLERDPTHAEARRGVANALIAQRQPAEALAVLEAAPPVPVRPDEPPPGIDPLLENTKGVALDMLGRHAEAVAAYTEALSVAPSDLDIRSNLALSQALAGEHATAVRAMRAVASAPMASLRHRQNLVIVLGLSGDLAAAEEAALRFSRGDAEVGQFLAYVARLRALPDSGARATEIVLYGL